MKWSIIGLIAVGVIAALCAAILVSFMLANGNGAARITDATFVEAAKDLEQGVVVTPEDVVSKTVPISHLPEKSYRNPAQVIGKVLVVTMAKGQAFTKSCFPAEGEGLQVAGRLPPGMRAVSLSISESSGLRGILYPGSTVDVLVSLKSSKGGNSVSRTLLEGVQVLAVDDKTLFSPKEKDGDVDSKSDKAKYMMVTVLVDSQQAQQLHLADRHGTLSLALRNPKDFAKSDKKTTNLQMLRGEKAKAMQDIDKEKTGGNRIDLGDEVGDVEESPESPRWKVTIIHGERAEDLEFDYSAEKKEKETK